MSDFVDIVRSKSRLKMAKERIKNIMKTADKYYLSHRASYPMIELRNMALVANLIINSALHRKESRGLHYIIDYPETDMKKRRNTIIKPPTYMKPGK